MNDYDKQAEDFCKKWNVNVDIKPVGIDSPDWDKEKEHIHFKVTISRTNHGEFTIDYWGTIAQLEEYRLLCYKQLNLHGWREYHDAQRTRPRSVYFQVLKDEIVHRLPAHEIIRRMKNDLEKSERPTIQKIRDERAALWNNPYNILACLEKWFEGSIDNFISEYGYKDIKTRTDWRRIEDTYEEIMSQVREVKYMFPEEEAMTELQEIC